ncbi:MAG: beta-3-deoxy-D-manno-oct-2-ulosonic acid transferase, partial [Alphaproteobacteria bacterium HGW-Alphaproteobacteria-2]
MRRILALAGHDLRPGLPPPGGAVVVWGRRAVAARGERVAAWRGAGLLRVEDAFLRSVLPGRAGTPTLGLMLDARGVHFDASAPSEIEHLLANAPTEDAALLA